MLLTITSPQITMFLTSKFTMYMVFLQIKILGQNLLGQHAKLMLRKGKRKEPHHIRQEEGHLLIMHNRAFIEITITVIIIKILQLMT